MRQTNHARAGSFILRIVEIDNIYENRPSMFDLRTNNFHGICLPSVAFAYLQSQSPIIPTLIWLLVTGFLFLIVTNLLDSIRASLPMYTRKFALATMFLMTYLTTTLIYVTQTGSTTSNASDIENIRTLMSVLVIGIFLSFNLLIYFGGAFEEEREQEEKRKKEEVARAPQIELNIVE
ncbi:hypothetical protein PMAYCL1PPCAC_20276 [Pristionchus mayeri]|uniref:Uncharacterized protein n=1 Tax=Pristionchus mayeri TaxID=1317129 RepID=A0AAN5CSZ6_9BILA|nr:hypothetical protein PMAYCL1PPCAC_20276 [Pristionchus mayeri]